MNESFIYTHMKAAVERAEQLGFEVSFYSEGKIWLKTKKKNLRAPEHPFYSANEIHCYLNGWNDGKFNEVRKK